MSTTPAGSRPNAFPPSIFDYLEGGAEDEVSLRRNRSSFDDWFFVPRWGAIENLDLTSTVLGKPTALPLVLAPTGGTGFSTRTANSPLPVRRWQRAFRTDWRT